MKAKTLAFLIFISSFNLTLAFTFDELRPPKFGNFPLISDIRKPIPKDRPIEIAVTCLAGGSGCKHQEQTAQYLSEAKA